MSEECVVAVYPSFKQAKEAVQALEKGVFPADQVSLVTHSIADEVTDEEEEALQYGDKSQRTAAQGAGLGGLIGILLGTSLLMVSGVGPLLIAGPIATGLTGAIVGGFLGAMSGWGVHPDHIRRYEERVKEGDLLVVANGDPLQVAEAKEILQQTEAAEVHLHAETSADTVDP